MSLYGIPCMFVCSHRKRREVVYDSLHLNERGLTAPYLPTNRSRRATLLYIWSACPEARHGLCVCGGRQAYLELSSYRGSQDGDAHAQTYIHTHTHIHTQSSYKMISTDRNRRIPAGLEICPE